MIICLYNSLNIYALYSWPNVSSLQSRCFPFNKNTYSWYKFHYRTPTHLFKHIYTTPHHRIQNLYPLLRRTMVSAALLSLRGSSKEPNFNPTFMLLKWMLFTKAEPINSISSSRTTAIYLKIRQSKQWHPYLGTVILSLCVAHIEGLELWTCVRMMQSLWTSLLKSQQFLSSILIWS